jgi:septum formation protein
MPGAAHQPAQARKRRLFPTCRPRFASRTALVTRRERYRKQHFIFHQPAHRHFAAGHDLLGPLGYQRLGVHFGLRRRKLKGHVNVQRELKVAQTSLTDQLQRAVYPETQRRAPPLLRHAQQFILKCSVIRAQRIAQTLESCDRPRPLQLRAGPREFKAVDDRLMRHTGTNGIIPKNLCQNKVMPETRRIVLASTSRYRRALLERLGLAFQCADPQADESSLPGETPATAALRLAEAKARAVAPRFPDALIVGSDQVASCDGARLDKPGSHENAARQLAAVSGRTADFDTAVVVLDAKSGSLGARLVGCRVTFRALSAPQIERYLRLEQPYDCAGSAKAEGLGITLIERIETDDPTALIGLPLIALTELLARAGAPVLG